MGPPRQDLKADRGIGFEEEEIVFLKSANIQVRAEYFCPIL
jgi:hypothetical protein